MSRPASVLGGVQFGDPLLEERAQCGDVDVTEGEINIAVAGQVPEHVGEHAYVEAAVDLACQREHFPLRAKSTQGVSMKSRAAPRSRTGR
jgi:hypothetical protein